MTDHEPLPDSPPADPRTAALRTAAADRTARAVTQAEKGIRALIKDGGQISFASVARASGVSRKFLHGHPDLSARINTLRAQQTGHAEATHKAATSGESAVIAALRRQLREQADRHRAEITALRSRVKEQDRQIATLYGKLGTESVS